jgi:glycosyltransferase involved in cell wall biosynthesis
MLAAEGAMGKPRPTVSACIITFDEEDRLGPCLESLAWADELIVVDSHSRDGTVALAKSRGAKVFERPFPGHVEQKNFAAEQARCDWIVSLDADERLSPGLRGELQRAIAGAPAEVVAFSMPRLTYYLGRWIRHGGWYPDRKVRAWRRGRARWGGRNPHDRVELSDGRVEALGGDIEHYSYRDLSDHLQKMNGYTTIMARERYREGERFRLWRLLLAPPARFARHYLLLAGFRDGIHGLFVALLSAYYVLLRHLKLWELERSGAPRRPGPP